MKLSKISYDRLKWIALVFIPAFDVFILTIGKIWGIPHYDDIGATVAACGVFLAALLGISSANYKKHIVQEIATGEAIAEDGNEGEEA